MLGYIHVGTIKVNLYYKILIYILLYIFIEDVCWHVCEKTSWNYEKKIEENISLGDELEYNMFDMKAKTILTKLSSEPQGNPLQSSDQDPTFTERNDEPKEKKTCILHESSNY